MVEYNKNLVPIEKNNFKTKYSVCYKLFRLKIVFKIPKNGKIIMYQPVDAAWWICFTLLQMKITKIALKLFFFDPCTKSQNFFLFIKTIRESKFNCQLHWITKGFLKKIFLFRNKKKKKSGENVSQVHKLPFRAFRR